LGHFNFGSKCFTFTTANDGEEPVVLSVDCAAVTAFTVNEGNGAQRKREKNMAHPTHGSLLQRI
jgi:hypothetical protein